MSGHSNHVCELELMGRRAYARGISYKSFYSWYGSILDRLQTEIRRDGSDIPEHFLSLTAQVETWKYFWPNEASLANIPTCNRREPHTYSEAQNQATALFEEPSPSPGLTLSENAPVYSDDIGETIFPRDAQPSSATTTCSAHSFASSPSSASVNCAHLLSIEQNVSQEKFIPPVPLKSLPTEQSLQKPIVRLPSTFQPLVGSLHNTTPSVNKLVTEKTPRLDGLDDGANNDIKDEPHGVADASESPFPYKPRANNKDHIDIAARQERWGCCANCHAKDHLLQFCMGPVDKFGFISGCPRCNTMTHLFEHCPNQTENESTSYLNYLVMSRHNRPPIRWTQDIRGIPNFWNHSMRPWTCEFSLKQASKHRDSYNNSGRLERNIYYDPAWHNPDTVPFQAYPKQRVQDMRPGEESNLGKLFDEVVLEHARTIDHLHRLERFRGLFGQDSTLLSQKFEEVLYLSNQISSKMLEKRNRILNLARSLDYIADLEWKEASGKSLLPHEAEAMKTKEARLIVLATRIDHYLGELHASYDNEMGLKERITRLLSQVRCLVNFESMQKNGATLNNVILEAIATSREKEKILKVWFGAYRRRFSLPPEPFFIMVSKKTASCTDFRDFAYSSFHALHYMPPPESPPPRRRKNPETMSSPTMDLKDTADQNSNILNRHSANDDMYRAYEQNHGRSRSPHDRQDSLPPAKDLPSVPLNTAPSSNDSNRPMELAGSVRYKVALSKEQKALEKEISGLQREIKAIEGFEKRTETLTTKQLEQVAKKEKKKARLASLRRHQENGPGSQTVRMIHKLEKSHSSRFTHAQQKIGSVNRTGSGIGQSSINPSSSIDSPPRLPSQVNNFQKKVIESKPRVSANSYAGKAAHAPPKLKPPREKYRKNKEVSSKQEEWPSTSSQARISSPTVTRDAKPISYAEKLRQMPPKSPPKQQRRETNIRPEARDESPSRSSEANSEAKELNFDVAKGAPTIPHAEKSGQIPHKPETPPAQQGHESPNISNLQEWPAMSSQTEVLGSNVTDRAPGISYAEMLAQEPPNSEALEEHYSVRDSSSAEEEWPPISSQTEVLSSGVIGRALEISNAEKIVQEQISPKLESSKESTILKSPAPFPILSAMETQSVASDESESTSYSDIASGLKKTSQDIKASFKVLKSKLPPPVYEIQEDFSSLNELQYSPVAEKETASTSNPASKISSSGEVFQEASTPVSVEQQSTSSMYVAPHRRRMPSFCSMKSSSSLQSGNTNIYLPPPRRRLSSASSVEFILPSNSLSLNKRRVSSGSMGHFSYKSNTYNPPRARSPKAQPNQLNSHTPTLRVLSEVFREDSDISVPEESQDINSKEQTSPLHSPALNNNQLLFPPTEYSERATRRCFSTPPSLDAEDMDLRGNISRASSPGSTNLQQKQTRTLRRPEKRRALCSGSSVSIQTSSLLVPSIAGLQSGIAHNYNGSSKVSSRTGSSVGSLSDTDFSFELPLPDDFDISFELEHPDEFDTSLHHPHPDDFLLSDDEDDLKECRVLNPPDSFKLDTLSDSSSNQDDINANADADATTSNNNPNIQEAPLDSWADERENIICWQCNKVGHFTAECPERAFNPLIEEISHSNTTMTSEHNANQATGVQDPSTLHQETSLNISTPTVRTETGQRTQQQEEEDENSLERKHPSPTHPPGAMRDNGSIVQFDAGDWKCGSNGCDYWNFAGNTCCLWCGASPNTAAVILGSRIAGAAHSTV
ncbi:1b034a1f-36a0-4486-b837-4464abd6160b [Sclerotinia trifoliorum]|uniref:1b034a1f-36a0-4486-b837-4464abd6160b n=1 Tax=Sclerotinia trifoliorum TaxID=28548 RepID=A0A8H2VPY5_9HELO|nr:1b034a1f-36a0-4486-b837-4464abd6160b [Sclerotinia trifoliorum]